MSESNEGQKRILQALHDGRTLTRNEIKEKVGIKGKYSGSWLKKLWELYERNLITITVDEGGHRKHFHKITPLGKRTIAAPRATSYRALRSGKETPVPLIDPKTA